MPFDRFRANGVAKRPYGLRGCEKRRENGHVLFVRVPGYGGTTVGGVGTWELLVAEGPLRVPSGPGFDRLRANGMAMSPYGLRGCEKRRGNGHVLFVGVPACAGTTEGEAWRALLLQCCAEVAGGVDEADVAEGLREVAQRFLGVRVDHLRVEAEVVGVPKHLFE